MKTLLLSGLFGCAVADSDYDVDHRSNCHADGRRLEAAGETDPTVPAFLAGGGPQPPPMDDQHIFKGETCVTDTWSGGWNGKGSCKWFECDAHRFAYCAPDYHCRCPDGMCAVALDEANPDDLTCQIQRTTSECPPGSGVFWKMEHIEVTYNKDEDSCEFTKTTGINDLWDAVAWTDGADIRNITWHTVGKNADRDFGYTADPIADSVTEPITHGPAVSMDIKDEIAPPAGLVVENGGHTTEISMTITELRTTDFNLDGRHWGTNHNLDTALDMHAIMWIKQRCGKLKVTDVRRWLHCHLSDWTSWGDCHPATAGGQTCGPGIQDRQRNILQQGTFGSECKDALKEHQSCNQGCCPVNCDLADWTEWGTCSETCGGGKANRTRKVLQEPSCGGTECGDVVEEENCNFWVECEPQDCEWSEWGDYGDCSAECGGGTRTRTRTIEKESKEGGEQCRKEDSAQVQTCNTQVCQEVDCEWTEWGPFSDCSAACNGGTETRVRTVSQEALNGGQACDGASAQSRECNVQACSDVWTAGDNAEIETDGVSFSGKAADAVVSSQVGVESVSVKNGNVEGSVQMGLAADAAADFTTGQSVVLPYKGAKENDIITIGEQDGHAKVFLNEDPTPVEDLGKIGGATSLLAKFILDEGATVRVDGIVAVPPGDLLEAVAVPITHAKAVPVKETNAPNWVWVGAVAAVSMSMMVAIARRSRPAPEDQPYQPMQQ